MAAGQIPSGFKSGTILMLGLVLLMSGLLTLANLRLRAHRKTVRSIAVLPFLSGTASPEVDRLCEAITQELTRNLTTTRELTVTPAETAARYKGKVLAPWKIGNELNVDVIVVGRVQRNHDTILIQTDLVNVSDESQLWGRQYEAGTSEPDTLPPRIAKDIANSVLAALSR